MAPDGSGDHLPENVEGYANVPAGVSLTDQQEEDDEDEWEFEANQDPTPEETSAVYGNIVRTVHGLSYEADFSQIQQ